MLPIVSSVIPGAAAAAAVCTQAVVSLSLTSAGPNQKSLIPIFSSGYKPETTHHGHHSNVSTPVHPGRRRMCSDNEGNGKQETRRDVEEGVPPVWVSPSH